MGIRPEQEPLLLEMIHAVRPTQYLALLFFSNVLSLSIIQAAYRDNTLGLPKVCPQENVTTIDQSIIYTFLNSHYDPSRMVLAGVGVEHDALVECAQKY